MTSSSRKRVAVIGAGSAGLVTLKSLLEDGHDACAFEQASDIGGLWNYGATGSEGTYESIADNKRYFFQCYKNLTANTSKYNTCFSDLPPDDAANEFMTCQELTDYLKRYADKFALRPHIRLNTRVVRLDKSENKWIVTHTTSSSSRTQPQHQTSTFDHVVIASGAFGYPKYPDIYESQRHRFDGLIVHSAQVRNDEQLFRGKRVLFIGGGYSGGDMATIAVKSGARQVYVIPTHRPQLRNVWAMNRVTPVKNGGGDGDQGDVLAWDYHCTRQNSIMTSDFGAKFASWLFPLHKTSEQASLKFPGDCLGVCHVDVMKQGLKQGQIQLVVNVAELQGNAVKLVDGRVLEDIDLIVMATGYYQRFPFLDHLWPVEEQRKCELYRYVIPPLPELDGIGFIMMQPVTFSVLLLGELQARWYSACMVSRDYTSQGTLFDDAERKKMTDEIAMFKSMIPAWFTYNYVFNVQGLAEILADEIGCAPPDPHKLMTSQSRDDVELGVALMYGPYTIAQYRIAGRGAWQGAKDTCIKLSRAIMGKQFDERVRQCMANHKL